ncbi:3'(2'),5'-bisphosphate nucleotidase 1 [Phymastichus coffea]|uniref:3'(2'),5'-bisphosphate nucleotidase 1 n=1 Tax=Phymastichus coffea TaxID=108790 RepID=UPI00273C4C86|nr:3'(2'),5'-bisphosphate nucleotidase 1 [Phymastichus coffea]XP_058807959.1 3'(2'),5'-bisphosphate nucleotidase 1 [Phymastichus coffea]
MAQSGALLTRLVASSVTAATKAGKIIRDIMSKGDLNIVEKGKNDLQTEADRSAQKCIVTSLSQQFPNVTIIGEEGPSIGCELPSDWVVSDMDQEVLKVDLPSELNDVDVQDICVWVDPLDGTSEYTQGLVEHVTVLVGIAVGDRAIGGVIHQPYFKNSENDSLGRTIWGIDGVGVGGFKLIKPAEGRRVITTTRSHCDSTVQAALDALKPDEILRVGGAGYKVMLLLEGKAHAYVFASKGCKKWDTCAPEAILHAAGGCLTDLHGKKYSYNAKVSYPNTGGVLATAPGQHQQWYLSLISSEIKQRLV